MTTEDFIKAAVELNESKKYQEAIDLLKEDLLVERNSPELYLEKARSFWFLKDYDIGYDYAKKAVEIDNQNPKAYQYLGNYFRRRGELEKAIQNFSKSIEFDPEYELSYIRRGNAYFSLKQFENAIQDFSKAIKINPKSRLAFSGRGSVYFEMEDYENTIKDTSRAIEIDPTSVFAYSKRAGAYFYLDQYENAEKDLLKAIEIDPTNAGLYYNLGLIKDMQGEYKEAIIFFEKYLKLSIDDSDYFFEQAKAEIIELNKKIEDSDYNEINQIINKIKKILLFDKKCLTHYTGLSIAQLLIIDYNNFRLSEGSYLNDTSEGRELFNYLELHTPMKKNYETVPEPFVERPFIASFVSDTKHDDLTLWRMYGKEAQIEAKGCAITIDRNNFISNLKNKLSTFGNKSDSPAQSNDQFTFYRVAYRNDDKFTIPGGTPKENKNLNSLLEELLKKVRALEKENKTDEKIRNIRERLNDIAYLFKSSEYQYEHEVRLVVSGVGFEKIINKVSAPPKVFIELVSLAPVITKITLGPKVERPDEWAAAFNYSLKKVGNTVEIVISHLPFK